MKKSKNNRTVALWLLFYCIAPFITLAQNSSQPTFQVIEKFDIKVNMRDGIRLSTDLYLPDSLGKFPVLLMRTPYGKDGENKSAHFFAERGYAVIIQDTRGRNNSEGAFNAFQDEIFDGYDTQQWIGGQLWCNGKIGTFGGSYVGFTQWMPAQLASPFLQTMFTSKTFSDFHKEAYMGGAFRILRFSSWSYSMSEPYKVDRLQMKNMEKKAFWMTPFIEQDKALGWKIPFLRDWLSHPENDQYWKKSSVEGNYTKIKTSVFNMGGWFDSFQQGTLHNFIKMTAPGIAPEIRAKQKLLIGPWVHGSESNIAGDIDFGENAAINTRELELQWFDNQLKGFDNGIMNEPPVNIFVMGENVWRYENEWPLARTKYQKYYFHSNGKANTFKGDGTLNTFIKKNEKPDTFVYDPKKPVITPGRDQPLDQRDVEARTDVLVYSSGVLKENIEVTGPVEVELYASSSATNTDFTAKLIDVYPDGKAIRLCEGIIRASFRNPNASPSAIQPGKIYKYNIKLWATSNLFKIGHQLRVEISSSNFPRFDRNMNTGIFPANDSTYVKATQIIYHNMEYPSCIILPVITE